MVQEETVALLVLYSRDAGVGDGAVLQPQGRVALVACHPETEG